MLSIPISSLIGIQGWHRSWTRNQRCNRRIIRAGGREEERIGWRYRNRGADPRRYVTRECKSVFMNGAAAIPVAGWKGVRGKRGDWWRGQKHRGSAIIHK